VVDSFERPVLILSASVLPRFGEHPTYHIARCLKCGHSPIAERKGRLNGIMAQAPQAF
jgi:hypothetical protein